MTMAPDNGKIGTVFGNESNVGTNGLWLMLFPLATDCRPASAPMVQVSDSN
jgi:hypothetical protein